MSELMSQFITPQMQSAFSFVIALLVILYVLVVVWVARDAYHRGTIWWLWAIVALVPVVGVIAYCLLRPGLMQVDRDEQELEVALKQRELMKYGECANCGYPVESDYVVCPNCHQRLKNLCGTCGHALDPSWSVCPYCATPVGSAAPQRRAPKPAPRRNAAPAREAAPRQSALRAMPLLHVNPRLARTHLHAVRLLHANPHRIAAHRDSRRPAGELAARLRRRVNSSDRLVPTSANPARTNRLVATPAVSFQTMKGAFRGRPFSWA